MPACSSGAERNPRRQGLVQRTGCVPTCDSAAMRVARNLYAALTAAGRRPRPCARTAPATASGVSTWASTRAAQGSAAHVERAKATTCNLLGDKDVSSAKADVEPQNLTDR